MTLRPDHVAYSYVRFTQSGDPTLLELMSDDLLDNVSGRRGPAIWQTVRDWLESSFSNRAVELNGTGTTADGRILVWVTVRATHVGSAFPWLDDRPASGRRVAWKQVHIFRTEADRIVEHWAVRDDLRCSRRLMHGTDRPKRGEPLNQSGFPEISREGG